MSELNTNQIATAIEQAMKTIPVVWPLQQFIATNPLWDLTDQSIQSATEQLQNQIHIPGTMSLREYWRRYQNQEITSDAIAQSVNTFCEHYSETHKIDLTHSKSFKELLSEFLKSEDSQQHLIYAFNAAKNHKAHGAKILFAWQVRDFAFDDVLDSIRSNCFRWLNAYFNPTDTQKRTIEGLDNSHPAKQDFYAFWSYMNSQRSAKWKKFLKTYPHTQDHQALIFELLSTLGVPEASTEQYLTELAWQLKGWMGYIKWHQNYPKNPYFNKYASPIDLTLVWLVQEVYFFKHNNKKQNNWTANYFQAGVDPSEEALTQTWHAFVEQNASLEFKQNVEASLTLHEYLWVWQHAYELSDHNRLIKALATQKAPEKLKQPKAQWAFCIDVRSEGFRRHLENTAEHETLGFAGFFGVTCQLNDPNLNKQTCQLPALLEPDYVVDVLKKQKSLCQQTTQNLSAIIKDSKKTVAAPFALIEMMGLWHAFTLLLKNYRNDIVSKFKRSCGSASHSGEKYDLSNVDLETQTSVAKFLLTGMGLTQNFAEFVIICGHTATTENNPYQAGLDCGACGGNSGISNAIIASTILNKAEVRKALADDGIELPETTIFVAACHDTTTDQIYWHEDKQNWSDAHKAKFESIKDDALCAGKYLQEERLRDLPGDKNIKNRAQHWAELIPEWALANNNAFIIASRTKTIGLDLQRRTFLHSYDAEIDPEGAILEAIFMGPVVVAHWINAQYYFSSIAPDHLGSGNKAIHNVLNHMGVMEGNQSDLKYGLPNQSVFYQGVRTHLPQRLMVLVDADPKIIETVINRHDVLKKLVQGKWIFVRSLMKSNIGECEGLLNAF